MKQNSILFICVAFLLVGILLGCGGQKKTTLVNTLILDTGDFESLWLDYDADDIYVLESDSDKVIVKEYMNEPKKRYYARTSTKNSQLLITEGYRPRRSSFKSYIELYIPKHYINSLSLHTTSGSINSEIVLNILGDFSVDTTSGIVNLANTKASNINAISTNGSLSIENINADAINIKTTNATTYINQICGIIHYQSKGGNLSASNIHGSGSFKSSGEGSIDISFADANGDIFVYSKNGTLSVILPNKLAFKFLATTKEGTIESSLIEQLAITSHTVSGIIGTSPDISVELETRNGDIKVCYFE